MRNRAFTLIEILLATVLAATLLGGVMLASGAIARDARRPRPTNLGAEQSALDLIHWDLSNSSNVEPSGDGQVLTLVGHGSIDRDSLRPAGRVARVVYQIRPGVGLVREQRYLDEPVRPEVWSDLVLGGVARFEAGFEHGIRVRISFDDGRVIERVMVR